MKNDLEKITLSVQHLKNGKAIEHFSTKSMLPTKTSLPMVILFTFDWENESRAKEKYV